MAHVFVDWWGDGIYRTQLGNFVGLLRCKSVSRAMATTQTAGATQYYLCRWDAVMIHGEKKVEGMEDAANDRRNSHRPAILWNGVM